MRYAEYAGERLLLTLWVGSLWAIGYLAVPLAFASLDRNIAADYAATLFYAVNIIGLISGAMLVIGKLFRERWQFHRSWRFWLLIVMLVITLIFTVFIQPAMADIKSMTDWRSDTALNDRFDTLHWLSENLYLFLSILGLVLVLTADKISAADWSNGEK